MPDWHPWTLDYYFPADSGGHSFRHSPVQRTDQHRAAEKAYRSTGKWQVAHAHETGERCVEECQVYGESDGIPVLGRGYTELGGANAG